MPLNGVVRTASQTTLNIRERGGGGGCGGDCDGGGGGGGGSDGGGDGREYVVSKSTRPSACEGLLT